MGREVAMGLLALDLLTTDLRALDRRPADLRVLALLTTGLPVRDHRPMDLRARALLVPGLLPTDLLTMGLRELGRLTMGRLPTDRPTMVRLQLDLLTMDPLTMDPLDRRDRVPDLDLLHLDLRVLDPPRLDLRVLDLPRLDLRAQGPARLDHRPLGLRLDLRRLDPTHPDLRPLALDRDPMDLDLYGPGPYGPGPYGYTPYVHTPYAYNPYGYYQPQMGGPQLVTTEIQPNYGKNYVLSPKVDKTPELVLYVAAGDNNGGPGMVYEVKGQDGQVIGKQKMVKTPFGIDMYRDHGVVVAIPDAGGKIVEIDDTGKQTMILEKDPSLPHPVKISMPGNSDTMVAADDIADQLVMSTIASTKTKVYQKFSSRYSSQPMSVAVDNDKDVAVQQRCRARRPQVHGRPVGQRRQADPAGERRRRGGPQFLALGRRPGPEHHQGL